MPGGFHVTPLEIKDLARPGPCGQMNKGREMQRSAVARLRKGALAILTTTMTALAGCGGGGGEAASANAAASDGGKSGSPNTAPVISGNPGKTATVGVAYMLAPAAQDNDGDTLAFSIENRPAWASFDTTTGKLSGTPAEAHVGTSDAIAISVSDGRASVALPAFTITVNAAAGVASPPGSSSPGVPSPTPVTGDAVALSWEVPTVTLSGQSVADVMGYMIHYGARADVLAHSIGVKGAGTNAFVVQGLKPGVYYFAVRAVTTNGTNSALSNIISRQIG